MVGKRVLKNAHIFAHELSSQIQHLPMYECWSWNRLAQSGRAKNVMCDQKKRTHPRKTSPKHL